MRRYKVISVHGETETLWHVVDTAAPEGEQPAILTTWHSPTLAHLDAQALNIPDPENPGGAFCPSCGLPLPESGPCLTSGCEEGGSDAD